MSIPSPTEENNSMARVARQSGSGKGADLLPVVFLQYPHEFFLW